MELPKGAKILATREGVQLVDLPPSPKFRYPTWSIEALEKDIKNAEDQIATFTLAIENQMNLVAERLENIALCKERDMKIAEWEAERGKLNL